MNTKLTIDVVNN